MKRLMIWMSVGMFLLGGIVPSEAAQPLHVVATLSTFGDLVKAIGGENVEVYTVASPRFNPHFIEPKPSDVLRVKKADLLVHAGLDLEAWRGPLLDAAGNRDVMPQGSKQLDLSLGIPLLEVPDHSVSRAEGDIHLFGNPHYWTDPNNGRVMAQAICDKLCALDPAHEAAYRQRLQTWVGRLDQSLSAWQARLQPYRGQELVGYHNEWPYLMRFAGLSMQYFLEPKPGIPPTPKQIEFLQRYVTQKHIRAIAQSSYLAPEAAQVLAKRTGAHVVVLCQNVRELPACSDYISTVEYNVNQLVQALAGSGG